LKPQLTGLTTCSKQGLSFSALPAELANGTVLEVLDLWGARVAGGLLPVEYEAWRNLTVFK
jgi:hypothetical protein